LPFDIAQMRAIFFSHTDLQSADRCREEIVRHLRQALDGAVDSPIAASIDLQRLQGGNTVERNIAELVTSFAELQQQLRRTIIPRDPYREEHRSEFVAAWYHNAARQRSTIEHLTDQVSEILRNAESLEGPELRRALLDAQSFCLGLRLSFLTSTPRLRDSAAALEGAALTNELWRALRPQDEEPTGDDGDQAEAKAEPRP
jgi:hypothetical protein